MDFDSLNLLLLQRASEFCMSWLPGGRIIGKEYCCGNIRGGPGDSMKVNLNTGMWSDFASSEKGGDLISLYAAIEGIKQGEAANRLSEQLGFPLIPVKPEKKPPIEHKITAPPAGTDLSTVSFEHYKYGNPSGKWIYRDKDGNPLFLIARYDPQDGKQFIPWSWSSTVNKWISKGWPAPRPLYGLDLLSQRPDTPVMIVEGEKATEAARDIAGGAYVCVSWPNGAKGVDKADWKSLYGRKVIIWPDCDDTGMEAARKIGSILSVRCPEVKIIDPNGQPEKWDAADAVSEGWDWTKLKGWAKPRASIVLKEGKQAVLAASNGAYGGASSAAKAVAEASAQVNITVTSDSEDPGSAGKWAIWESLGLTTSSQGNPHCNVDNILRILEKHEKISGLVWFDEFHKKYYTNWKSSCPKEWDDVDTLSLTILIQRTIGLSRLSDDIVYKACQVYAHRHVRNEPRDWVESLKWDEKERIQWFLSEAYGCSEESEYIWAASKNFWVGMMARIYKPGCQVDNMLVLEGLQGIGKTQSLRLIGGRWHAEAGASVTERDFFMSLKGKLLVEIAELNSFSRAEVTRIKQVLTCTIDRYREPYQRTAQDHPRRSIFVGSTNAHAYLKDDTGGRRFWPVTCKKINMDYIEQNREQLFAEAAFKFKRGDTWYEMPEAETVKEQEIRRHGDEWESAIVDWLNYSRKDEVVIREIGTECLKIDIGKLDRAIQMRIASILRNLGWEKIHKADLLGKQQIVWKNNES